MRFFIFFIVLTLSLFGCNNQVVTEKSKINNIYEKVKSGDLAWLRDNFIKDSEFGRYRDSKPNWGDKEREVAQFLYEIYTKILTLAASEETSKEVRDAAFFVLSAEPQFAEVHPVTKKKYVSDEFLRALTRGTSLTFLDKIKISQGLSKYYGFSSDFDDDDFLKNEMCRVVGSGRDGSIEDMAYLMSLANFDVGIVRCENHRDRISSSQFKFENASEEASCPMSLRRLAGEVWGRKVNAKSQQWLSRIEDINKKDLNLKRKTEEVKKSFANLPNLSSVKSMIGLLDPIDKWDVGTCSTKLK